MIVDCFLFLNEFDILEIRLNELKGLVDRFVLVEGELTHSNKEKPLFFEENKNKFSRYPIEHVVMRNYDGINRNDSRAMEKAHREVGIKEALKNLTSKDLLVLSDCDEIPKAETIRKYLDTKFRIASLRQGFYYYYMNCRCIDKIWLYARLARPYEGITYNEVRRGKKKDIIIDDGGWHFSYVSNPEEIQYKLGSFHHVEYDKPPYNTLEYIKEKVRTHKDLFGRNQHFVIDKDLSHLPEYVLKNIERYRKYIYEGIDSNSSTQ